MQNADLHFEMNGSGVLEALGFHNNQALMAT